MSDSESRSPTTTGGEVPATVLEEQGGPVSAMGRITELRGARSTLPYDRATSESLAEILGAQAQRCWNNAVDVVMRFPEAVYVEGWVVVDGLPVPYEHGWVEMDGYIIDTTPTEDPKETRAYFPGVRFALAELIEQIGLHDSVELPAVRLDGDWGWSTPGYRHAYRAAMVHAVGAERAAQALGALSKRYPEDLD